MINQKTYKLNFQKQQKLCNLFLQKLIKLIHNTGNILCLCCVQENYLLVIHGISNIFKAQFTCLLDNHQNGSVLHFKILKVGKDPQDWVRLLTDHHLVNQTKALIATSSHFLNTLVCCQKKYGRLQRQQAVHVSQFNS